MRRYSLLALFAVVLLISASGLHLAAYQAVTVPEGTIVALSMETSLSSETARVGDRFRARVKTPVVVNNQVVIPEGSYIEGHVSSVEPARRASRSGTIGVDFDRLILPNNRSYNVTGVLTSLNPEERKKIDEEGRVEGGSTAKRSVVFIGGGAGVGAAIGAIAGGGKGVAIGSGAGAVLGTAAVLLSKGHEAKIGPGTDFGMELTQPLLISDPLSASRVNENTIFTSREMIAQAQTALKDLGYDPGPADGRMGYQTRRALRDFQRDKRLTVTGELDVATARELGIISDTGFDRQDRPAADAELVRVLTARAERLVDGSVRVHVQTEVNTGGWRVFGEQQLRGDTLEVWARGVRPRGIVTQAIENPTFDVTVRDEAGRIRRVVVHGAAGDVYLTIPEMSRGTGELLSRIEEQAGRVLEDYRQQLGIRRDGDRNRFDDRRSYGENQLRLLVALSNFANIASVYSDLTESRNSNASLRTVAQMLVSQAQEIDSFIRLVSVNSDIARGWERIQDDVRSIAGQFQISYFPGRIGR